MFVINLTIMSVDERRTLYLRLDRIIRMRFKGNATVLAQRLSISRSTFFRCLDDMKAMGAPIRYNEMAQYYYYEEEGNFFFGFIKNQGGKAADWYQRDFMV